MATAIVNSYNLYFDSERDRASNSNGDRVFISLNETPITCATNQFLRLSLQAFSSYRTSTDVNPNNNIFRISLSKEGSGGIGPTVLTDYPLALECGSYPDIITLQEEFGFQVAQGISASTGVSMTGLSIKHMNRQFIAESTTSMDGIMRLRIQFATPHLINDGSLHIKFFIEDGDIFELMGGNRLFTLVGFDKSVDVDTQNADYIDITGYYTMQLSTQQNTYLKTNLTSTALQTKSYSAGSTDQQGAGSGTESSRILGRIINNTQFNTFTTETNMEYFINLTSKTLNFIELFIEDSHGRPIPPGQNYELDQGLDSQTGKYNPKNILDTTLSSSANQQNTLGNRSFEGCLKVDVVQVMSPPNNTLQAPRPEPDIPPRFTSNLPTSTQDPVDRLRPY